MPADSFHCLMVAQDDSGVRRQVTQSTIDELPQGDVLIRVAYSALNYKDALSATGNKGVTRKYPHIPGIDAAGTVAESQAPNFKQGDKVLVTGFDLGQDTWGGFAEFVRVPAGWVIPLPKTLSLKESMVLGTAGFTAAQCIHGIQHRGVLPEHGDVVVTGATGGVGSLAVAILARIGYTVVAVTGKPQAHDYLKGLGASRIISREDVDDRSSKPLLSANWAAAVDTVGGNTLATLVRSLKMNGVVAACGLVGGAEFTMSVFPFILRAVDLVGIDSAHCPLETRIRLWDKLAQDWKPTHLEGIGKKTVNLNELDVEIQQILAGQTIGRVLVTPTAAGA